MQRDEVPVPDAPPPTPAAKRDVSAPAESKKVHTCATPLAAEGVAPSELASRATGPDKPGSGAGSGSDAELSSGKRPAPADAGSADEPPDDAKAGEEDDGEREVRLSKKPRLVWTPELHTRFMNAVNHLGVKNAVPKTILQLMNVEGMTRENVASHLQKYRLYLKRMHGLGPGDRLPEDVQFPPQSALAAGAVPPKSAELPAAGAAPPNPAALPAVPNPAATAAATAAMWNPTGMMWPPPEFWRAPLVPPQAGPVPGGDAAAPGAAAAAAALPAYTPTPPSEGAIAGSGGSAELPAASSAATAAQQQQQQQQQWLMQHQWMASMATMMANMQWAGPTAPAALPTSAAVGLQQRLPPPAPPVAQAGPAPLAAAAAAAAAGVPLPATAPLLAPPTTPAAAAADAAAAPSAATAPTTTTTAPAKQQEDEGSA